MSDKSFTIPAWEVRYFDLTEEKSKVLYFIAVDVKITAPKFN